MDQNIFTIFYRLFVQEYVPILLALFAAVAAGRIFEWGLIWYTHGSAIFAFSYPAVAIVHDFQFSFIAAFLLWLISYGAKKIWPARRELIISIIIAVVGCLNLLLIYYFSVTLIPLGPDFWAYSLREISDTVIAEGIPFVNLFLLMPVVYLFYRAAYRLLSKPLSLPSGSNALIAVTGLLLMFYHPSRLVGSVPNNVGTNKFSFFLSGGNVISFWPGNDELKAVVDRDYPFLRTATDEDVLGPFFKDFNDQPDIVFLLVEGLGGAFTGTGGEWRGFAPFIDSLAAHGLYWRNGLSLSGRTFGMMPSLFGSLPPARKGFMDAGPEYPDHLSLISLLKKNGYHTSFFSGYDTYFDKLDYFLEYNGIDFVLNNQLISKQYNSARGEQEKNYWGYDDQTMFTIASLIGDTAAVFPRLEIYHTLQSHSPFTVPNKQKYEAKFDSLLISLNVPEEKKEAYLRYRKELTTLVYTDNALRNFMKAFKKRDRFKNTIFILTGDHWLIPIPQSNQISRYHVPIIIYSPLLKKPVVFESVITHANIVPSLLALINNNVELDTPEYVHWLGSTMDTVRTFRNIHSLPLMKNKNQLTDYIDGPYFLAGHNLYKLEKGLRLAEVSDESRKKDLQRKLSIFTNESRYAIASNRLYPESEGKQMPEKYRLIADYDTLLARIDSINLHVDEQFQLARKYAFEQYYDKARAIAERLLVRNPDYHDVRLLLGRIHAWKGNYQQARIIFRETIKRDSLYEDSYSALFDNELWDGNYESALEVVNTGLKYHEDHEPFLEKKIQILVHLNRTEQAELTYVQLKNNYPDNENLMKLKQFISE